MTRTVKYIQIFQHCFFLQRVISKRHHSMANRSSSCPASRKPVEIWVLRWSSRRWTRMASSFSTLRTQMARETLCHLLCVKDLLSSGEQESFASFCLTVEIICLDEKKLLCTVKVRMCVHIHACMDVHACVHTHMHACSLTHAHTHRDLHTHVIHVLQFDLLLTEKCDLVVKSYWRW